MDRVVITRGMVGIVHMQVCAVPDATDQEILAACNRENPSGTSNGWAGVIRENNKDYSKQCWPGTCEEHPERKHFLVYC